ncbi:MAG TPA: hypothetical protein VK582_24430 [Pyrinomonadaceae bacterium]|nr:hypothetical protein [Pyrinomonadaceae bacterium]
MRILVRAIGWVVVSAFAITFGVTVVGLLRLVEIQDKYLSRLFASLVIELLSAGFFLFYSGLRDESSSKALTQIKRAIAKQDGVRVDKITPEYVAHRPFSKTLCDICLREYHSTIYWYPEYAETIFNYKDRTPNYQCVDPHSDGTILYYRNRAECYKGFSIWVSKNGTQNYSQLVVMLSEFEFTDCGKLKKVCLNVAFRNQLVEFSYGPYTHYRMRFDAWSGARVRGKMLLVQNGDTDLEVEVGDVVMELI